MGRYAFGRYTLDTSTRELCDGDAVVGIQPQVFDVVAYLVEHAARVVGKEELLDAVWGSRFVSESALTTRIKQARSALGDDGQRQAVIKTLHGRGYRFVAPVETLHSDRPTPVAPGDDGFDQELRFCTASDGVRLAYALSGAGPPLVKAANWLSHLDFDRESPVWRHWLVELSRRFRLVRYDERGSGLSDWELPELSFECWVRDLESVVDAVGLDRFPLLGISQGGPVAIAYAARHPERVSHLVLLGTFAQGGRARGRTPEQVKMAETLVDLVRVGWERPDPTFRQVFASQFLPEGTQEEWRVFDELQRRSTSAENAVRFMEVTTDLDVTELAKQVETPTLVMCARGDLVVGLDQSCILAELIPNARVVFLDSVNHLLPARDPAWPRFLAELEAFVTARDPDQAAHATSG